MRSLRLAVMVVGLAAFSRAAEPQLCFEMPIAKKLLADLEADREIIEIEREKVANCDGMTQAQAAELAELRKMIAGLELDKSAYAETSDRFKALAEESAGGLARCEASKPSRATWYGWGIITGILATLLASHGFP